MRLTPEKQAHLAQVIATRIVAADKEGLVEVEGTSTSVRTRTLDVIRAFIARDEKLLETTRSKIQAMAHLLGFKGPTEDFIEELTASKDKLFANVNRLRMAHSAEWRYYSEKIKKNEKWTRGYS